MSVMLTRMSEAARARKPITSAEPRAGRAFVFALAAFLALTAGGRSSDAAGCKKSTHKVKTTFKVEKGKLTYSRKLNKAELYKKHRRVGQDLEVRGLTVATPVLSYLIAHRTFRSGGKTCVYPSQVEATVGYKTIEVFVAKEYRKASCQYKAVLIHEKEHVAAYRKALKKGASRIKSRLKGFLKKFTPISVAKGEDPTQAIADKINAGLEKALTDYSNEAEDLNAVIDLPKNYRKTEKKCKKWP